MPHWQLLAAASLLLLLLLLTALPAAAADAYHHCRQGSDWFPHNDRCYFWSNDDRQNWFKAEKLCRSYGGGLVTIQDKSLNDFLFALTQCTHSSWIGLVNTDSSILGHINGYDWWDGSQKNYSVFSGSSTSHYNCGMMSTSGRWRNRPCQSNLAYLCSAPRHSGTGVDSVADTSYQCPSGWMRLDGNCYVLSEKASNYFNAQMSCEAKGATVASVLSQREHTRLILSLGCSASYWIGLEKSRPCFTNPERSFCWVWMDRSALDYSRWAAGQQTDRREMECVHSTGGEWRTDNCYSERRYLCKKSARAAGRSHRSEPKPKPNPETKTKPESKPKPETKPKP